MEKRATKVESAMETRERRVVYLKPTPSPLAVLNGDAKDKAPAKGRVAKEAAGQRGPDPRSGGVTPSRAMVAVRSEPESDTHGRATKPNTPRPSN